MLGTPFSVRRLLALSVALLALPLAAPAAADQIAHVEQRPTGAVVGVLDTETGEVGLVAAGEEPSWGPGGGRLAVAERGGGNDRIVVVNNLGGCREILVSAPGVRQPALSDDGVRLLYVAPSPYGPLVHERHTVTGADRVVGAGTAPRWLGGSAPSQFLYVQRGTVRYGDVNDPNRGQVVVTGSPSAVTFDEDPWSNSFFVGDEGGLASRTFGERSLLVAGGANPSALGPKVYFDGPGDGGRRAVQVIEAPGGPPRTVRSAAVDLTDPDAAATPAPGASGYRMVSDGGGVFTFGAVCYHGSMGGRRLNRPIVNMAETPSGAGYWLVAGDGGVFSFGDAQFHGSTGSLPLRQPIVNMAAAPTGRGYWLLAGDGGVFSFGDARFHGAATGRLGTARAVALVPTSSGGGYWVVAGDGRVLSFGDAPARDERVFTDSPIVDAARSGTGLLLLGRGGGVFSLGADFHGSSAGSRRPWMAIRSTPGGGYWLFSADGVVHSYGDAAFYGSLGTVSLRRPLVGS